MGLRMRKSFKAGPARVTFSKSGIGYSVGGKGFRYTKKAGGGYRTTSSIPGTGISYSKDHSASKSKSKAYRSSGRKGTNTGHRKSDQNTFKTLLILAGIIYVLWAAFFAKENPIHSIIGLLVGIVCVVWSIKAIKKNKQNPPTSELEQKLQGLSDKEFDEYKETLLRFVKENKDSVSSEDMKKLIRSVREEDERRKQNN